MARTERTCTCDADDVTGDTLFSQTEITYDDAGNATFQKSRARLHDATGR